MFKSVYQVIASRVVFQLQTYHLDAQLPMMLRPLQPPLLQYFLFLAFLPLKCGYAPLRFPDLRDLVLSSGYDSRDTICPQSRCFLLLEHIVLLGAFY